MKKIGCTVRAEEAGGESKKEHCGKQHAQCRFFASFSATVWRFIESREARDSNRDNGIGHRSKSPKSLLPLFHFSDLEDSLRYLGCFLRKGVIAQAPLRPARC